MIINHKERIHVGFDHLLEIRHIPRNSQRAQEILFPLMDQVHRRYGFCPSEPCYGDILHEAYLDGVPFASFLVKRINRKVLGSVNEMRDRDGSLLGIQPITKYTEIPGINWHEQGKNSKSGVKTELFRIILQVANRDHGILFGRETVSIATVDHTSRSLSDPSNYLNSVCAGALPLNQKQLRAGTSLAKMNGRGYLVFYSFVTPTLPNFPIFTKDEIKQASAEYGWHLKQGQYWTKENGGILLSNEELLDRRILLAKELSR